MSSHRDHIRLLILQTLAKQPQYVANQEVVIKELRSQGYALSRDMLHIELSWLESNADAVINKIVGGVYISTITNDGHEISEGIAIVPGVAQPSPRNYE